jgi:protein-S-isoprenylcysteine O-methyltransferase Ste14
LGSIGWAIAWQSWPAVLVASGLIPFFMAKARHEERFLFDQFPDYADYAKSTKRFLPWVY